MALAIGVYVVALAGSALGSAWATRTGRTRWPWIACLIVLLLVGTCVALLFYLALITEEEA